MHPTSSSLRNLARRLHAVSRARSERSAPEAVLVSDALRTSLTKFAGSDGFASLLRRALTLASAERHQLRKVSVSADGHLEGLEKLTDHMEPKELAAAGIAITSNLLFLLFTFIGEPLTIVLLREVWPDISVDEGKSNQQSTETDR